VALRTAAIDAWSTWDPYTAQLEVAQGCRRIADGAGLTPGLGFFFARGDALADAAKRAALGDFAGGAREWGLAHIDSYAQTWSSLVGLPLDVSQKLFTRAQMRATPIDASVIADEQKTIDLYLRSGLIKTRLEASDIVSPIFTSTIVAGLKK
jgi:sulfonate transport system substrate-binding protein